MKDLSQEVLNRTNKQYEGVLGEALSEGYDFINNAETATAFAAMILPGEITKAISLLNRMIKEAKSDPVEIDYHMKGGIGFWEILNLYLTDFLSYQEKINTSEDSIKTTTQLSIEVERQLRIVYQMEQFQKQHLEKLRKPAGEVLKDKK